MAAGRHGYFSLAYAKGLFLLALAGVTNCRRGWHHLHHGLHGLQGLGLGGLGWSGLAGYGLGGLGWAGVGLGGLGLYGGSYLLPGMLSLLATPAYGTGIFPSLCLRIILCKARLAVYGPVGLGTFIIGAGSGLLIGRLLGIRSVLNHFWPKPKYPYEIKINGWRAGTRGWHGWTGWKPWRLKLRLPFFRRFRLHRHFPPPPHYDFHHYPPIKHHYSHKPYGTYSHAPDSHGWGESKPVHGWGEATTTHHESGWKAGRGPGSSYESTSTHVYHDGESGDTDIKYGDGQGHVHYSTGHDHEHSASEHKLRYKRSDSNKEIRIQDLVKTEVEKMKSENYKAETSKEEEAMLNELLQEQFVKDIADTIEEGKLPKFIPIPDEEVIDPMNLNETITESPTNSTTTETETIDSEADLEKENKRLAESLFSSVMKSIQTLNPLNFIPETFVSWLTGTDPKASGDSNPRGRRGSRNEVNVDSITKSVAKDIKNLFGIISFLDVGQCLEKMICEIHVRGRKFTARQIANSYEGNILTAFKIMDSIMPDDKDTNVVKYREAARLGKQNQKADICVKNYPGCSFSTNRLIRLGSLIEGTSTQEDVKEKET